MADNNSIAVTYSDEKLRILIEEYITMQRTEFSFMGICSYILCRAMEEEKTTVTGLYDSNELALSDCERVTRILDKIVKEKRIALGSDKSLYMKIAD